MEAEPRTNSVFRLQERLGTDWSAIAAARNAAIAKKAELRKAFEPHDSEDTSIVVFGSLDRDEFTSGSDIDWTLLVDGIANPEHWDSSLHIGRILQGAREKGPGREGTFGGLTFSHDLIHRIGGEDDTNRNTTQRILLLLESAAIGRSDAYHRVLRNVLKRYISQDYGMLQASGPYSVPRFLQNDIARYWRTVAVDFAYKQRQRGSEGWALRTAKLRISRKLTYVSGLLTCFSCELSPSPDLASSRPGGKAYLPAVVEQLWQFSQLTPLEIVADVLLQHSTLDGVARELFAAYNEFLVMLDDKDKRQRLEKLSQAKVASDKLYQEMRDLSHRFQNALTRLFSKKTVQGCLRL